MSENTLARTRDPDSLTLAIVKNDRRIAAGFTDDDAMLTGLIEASLQLAERETWRDLLHGLNTWTLPDGFGANSLVIEGTDAPLAQPVIKYTDVGDTEQTLSTANYGWVWVPGSTRVHFSQPSASVGSLTLTQTGGWPTDAKAGAPVTVEFYTGLDPMPQSIDRARLMMIGAWYENREEQVIGQTTNTLGFGVDRLLSAWSRRHW